MPSPSGSVRENEGCIAAIALMGPELDANYRAVVADAIDWKSFKGD